MPPANAEPSEELQILRSYLRALESVLVCYSGGIDSALVLAVAHEQLGPRSVGLTAVSPSLAEVERRGAIDVASAIGARHELVETRELERVEYAANGPDRCFHCKSELYEVAASKREEWGLAHVVNGTNRDDLGDYRPGLRAASLASVKSPLLELGFGKERVRALARELGLSIWEKPASACLASRLPFGTAVTKERLDQIGKLEAELRALGFRQLRVRWHERVARIELGLDELPRACEAPVREAIVEAGKRSGFTYVTLDLGGYRQGSHNEALRRLPVLDATSDPKA